MDWAVWIAWKHPMLGHVPVAVAILLPWALLAAQRPGRGIKPWWITCRYLAWAGILASLVALISGFLQARHTGVLEGSRWISDPTAGHGALRLHQFLAFTSFGCGMLCLMALFRRRQEHQGLGFLGLLLGCIWAGLLIATGVNGAKLGRPVSPPRVAEAAPPLLPQPVDTRPEPSPLLSLLDYGRLESMHAEPVKSAPHGNRWIRTWASPEAVEAYKAGKPLPEGAQVVLSTLEDRWGRPGFETGPLCGIQIKEGKPVFAFHWARVPQARRGETGGADRASWQGEHPGLQNCLGCHPNGLVPKAERSTFTVPRKPRESESPTR